MIIKVKQSRAGHLTVVPVSERKQKEVINESVKEECDLYLQGEQEVEHFIENYVPKNKRKDLNEGWSINIKIEDATFVEMAGGEGF